MNNFFIINAHHLDKLYTYIKVGYLLHLVTILEILMLYTLCQWLNIEEWLQHGNFILKMILLFPFISMPLFPLLDARSRYQNYKMLRDQFYFYGFQQRIVKPFIKSRCQRDAVIAAAQKLGLDAVCKNYFYKKGYRWYHLLPDFFFANPRLLLCKHFWLTTFFVKKYHSRINDKMIRMYREQRNAQLILAA
ncbi:MAG TPA: hypothetical protein VN958_10235 [Chitinophagaceae bacterium]|nr:hypothetical protein [Chitinophagaceae bacterium]